VTQGRQAEDEDDADSFVVHEDVQDRALKTRRYVLYRKSRLLKLVQYVTVWSQIAELDAYDREPAKFG
jgi:hypothetical protein